MLDNIQYQAVIADSLVEVVVLQKLIRTCRATAGTEANNAYSCNLNHIDEA
jgi:hypothetical protein